VPRSAEELLAAAERQRLMAECYARVRAAADPMVGWEVWRAERDRIRRAGPADRRGGRPSTFAYDPSWRCLADLEPASPIEEVAVLPVRLQRVGTLRFDLAGTAEALDLYWLDQYGGGFFLPFRDATNGATTSARGRHLLDHSIGADLGSSGERFVLDFNFAYQPESGDGLVEPRWPDGANVISRPIEAGERRLDR
jgi:uncharacterized protein (DUF1684 family)